MKIKKLILFTIVFSMILGSVALANSWKQNIEVEFNSVNLEVNDTPVTANNILYNGTTYVPLRAAAEMLDCDVSWDENTNTAKISQFDDNIQLGYIFWDMDSINSILRYIDNIADIADYRFTKSHWTDKILDSNENYFDYITDYYNWISEDYKALNEHKEILYIVTADKIDKSNLDNLYINLDSMYGKLSYIYSLVNNLVSTSGYICTESEFGYLLSELNSLKLNIHDYYIEIYRGTLDYLFK